MKFRIALFLIGVLPLVLGKILERIIMQNPYVGHNFLALVFGLLVLAVWFAVGYVSIKWFERAWEAVAILNAVAFIALVLVFVQHEIIGHFFTRYMGRYSQNFFLPLIRVSMNVLRVLPLRTISFLSIALMSFALMVGATCVGRLIANKRHSKGA